MLITNLDGKELNWKPRGQQSLFDAGGSKLHQAARIILKEHYRTNLILEEVSIPVRNRKTLYLDFYVPTFKIGYEIQGQQHYKFTSMFHKSKADFMKQKKNDREKAEWCEINSINLIELKYDEESLWPNQI